MDSGKSSTPSAAADRWDMGETRDLIERLYGHKQLAASRGSLRSIDDRLRFARFHLIDAREAFKAYVSKIEPDASILELWAENDEESYEFNILIRRVNAYLIASIQSLHALPDTIAHAIYLSLRMDQAEKPIPARQITAWSVEERLKADGETFELAGILKEFRTGGAFPHIAAAANRAKHTCVVFSSIKEDATGQQQERHHVTLDEFLYDGTRYPQVEAEDFIIVEFDRCAALIAKLGNALNRTLRSRQAAA